MTRRLLNHLTVLSLLLCGAVIVLWARSYWFADTLRWSGARVYSVGTHNGLLVWNDFRPDPGSPPLPWRQSYRGRDRGYDWDRLGRSAWNRAGFCFAVGYTAGSNRIRQVAVPYWFVAITTGVPSMIGIGLLLRRLRRAQVGRCRRCGYDLRATPGRCPECGTEASEAKASGVSLRSQVENPCHA